MHTASHPMAPAGTPKDVVAKLHEAVQKAIVHPEVHQLWGRQGVIPYKMSQDEFGKFLRDDIDKWAKVIKAAGITPR